MVFFCSSPRLRCKKVVPSGGNDARCRFPVSKRQKNDNTPKNVNHSRWTIESPFYNSLHYQLLFIPKWDYFDFCLQLSKVSLLSIEFSLKCGTTKASGYRTTVFILLWIVKLESYFPPPPLTIEYRTRICDKIDTWKAGDFRYIIPAALFLINSNKKVAIVEIWWFENEASLIIKEKESLWKLKVPT